MGKPTKKNIRRKNRRTRRKVNKKKMKKGGDFWDFNIKLGLCNRGEKINNKVIKYNDVDITGKFLNETGQETATITKMCKNTDNTTAYLFKNDTNGKSKNERMTSNAFKEKYIYYKPDPDAEQKFKYDIDINGDTTTLSEKSVISKIKKPFSSMFSIFKKNK